MQSIDYKKETKLIIKKKPGVMDEKRERPFQQARNDNETPYSKAIKAGKRIYYLDAKRNQNNELYLTITESKKNISDEGKNISFEKHKIFLFEEDFKKFVDGFNEVIDYIKRENEETFGEK